LSVSAGCGAQAAFPIDWAPDFLSPGLNCPGREADHQPPSVAVLLPGSYAYSNTGTVFIFTFYCHFFFTGWRGIVEISLEGIRLCVLLTSWWGSLSEGDHWGDPDVDGRIILRGIFRMWEGVVGTGWSGLSQDRDRWRALVSTVMNFGVS
jgi:hypothetical protein